VNRKTYYKIFNGKELASQKLKFNQQGDTTSNLTFATKKIKIEIRNKEPYFVGDTLFLKLKIENAKYHFSEATIGYFDENLNVTRSPKATPVYAEGDENNELRMGIKITKAGVDTLTWLVRDYKFDYRTDSTGNSIGEESYFAYPINVLEKRH
jgi:hypothetical protein